MNSSHELATPADPVLPVDGRLPAPPWVIALVGASLVLAGLAYFVVRARRARPRR